ncbi:tyrosine-type recombinase/integrase [Blastococcus sp. BMG 814]|uniref:Tyrosine-type recombinase/integrase n=1 Tax=Blastococcus carthaginiensis TaxID=3050034 RepID=A0ABT9I9F1_9ACTN|nr:tyrosine-type recombinase/integrase [Blastococcus carthaginiensis]MDP5182195.1 tyrosine-type recombinase/integrase [Blastococcus carthaginiensis]
MGDKRVPEPWQRQLDAWEGWLKASGAPSTTIGQRLYQLRRFAADHPATIPWQTTLDDLVLWLAQHDQWKPATRRAYRGALRAFFAWAVAAGHLERSPAAALPRVKATRGLPRPVPEDVLRAAVAGADERVRLMLLLAAYGGLRRAEIAELRQQDARRDADGGWWLRVHGKGDAYRDVPLTGALAMAVRGLPPGWLFPSPTRHGDHLTPAHLGVLARRVLPAGWTLHTLRHRFATRAHARGADVAVIAELLGHANLENVRVYTRIGQDKLRSAVEGAA